MIWGKPPRGQCEGHAGNVRGKAWCARRNERDETMKARWLARLSFVLMLAAVAVLIGFAELGGLVMIVIGAIGAVLVVAGVYTFLAHRGVLRWIAAAVVILTPVAVLVLFALHNLIWVALVSVALIVLAGGAGRRALPPAAAGPG